MSLLKNNFKRQHHHVNIITQCVHWFLDYSLILRNLEMIMIERGIIVDHPMLLQCLLKGYCQVKAQYCLFASIKFPQHPSALQG